MPSEDVAADDPMSENLVIQREEPTAAFDQSHAATYDQRFAKLAPMRDALHLITGAILADLRADARVLIVGAGTGQELLYLAAKFPGWGFCVVEPSGPMMQVCRRKADEAGIAARCTFHDGYLESLSSSGPFDAATSLLVSQFILAPAAREAFFRDIARRLRSGGILVSADLASDMTSATFENLFGVWLQLMRETGSTREQLERLRVLYGRDVAVVPAEQVSAIIASAGFERPVLFLQTCLIHAWFARRASTNSQ